MIPRTSIYDIIIFALNHNEFEKLTPEELSIYSNKDTIIFDLTNNLYGENILNL